MDSTEQINEINNVQEMNQLILEHGPPGHEEQLSADNQDLYEEELNAFQDDEDPPDGFVPTVSHGLSNEDYTIIFKQRHPTTSQWKDSAGLQLSNASAIIDGGTK